MTHLWEPVCGEFSAAASSLPCLGPITEFAWSSFFITLIGALAGALAGAWAAQRSAAKGRRQEELIKEIRNTNAAILIGQAIFNIAIKSKMRWSQPLKTAYEEERILFDKYGIDYVRHLDKPVNLSKWTSGKMPIHALNSLMVTEISSTQAMRAFIDMEISIDGFLETLERRNRLIEKFEKMNKEDYQEFADLYFGEPRDGVTNKAYQQQIGNICAYNDDIIFFCIKMCDYLSDHVTILKQSYKKLGSQKIATARMKISPKISPELIPSDEAYSGWLSAHQSFDNTSPAKWWHFRARLKKALRAWIDE